MKKNLLSLLLLTVFSGSALAQNNAPYHYCGTSHGDQKLWIDIRKSLPKNQADNGAPIYIPIQVHNVGNDNGSGFFSTVQVYEALCTLNKDFEQVGVQFYLEGSVNYISKSIWNTHPEFKDGEDMMLASNVKDRVNCYLVNDPAGNCGYYTYRGDGIALSKGCIQPNDHTWAHEMGHYLSLPHTFFGWEGKNYTQKKTITEWQKEVWTEIEDLTGRNCQNQADNFCDTPADYISYRWGCTSDKKSILQQKDKFDNIFYSEAKYFMSYALDDCMSIFSKEQIDAMRSTIMGRRDELLRPNVIPVAMQRNSYNNIVPVDSSIIPHRSVSLSWDPIPGAKLYVVTIARNSALSLDYKIIQTEVSNLKLDSLVPAKSYFWKIRAVGDYDFCIHASATKTFKTASLISAIDDSSWEAYSVSPNPIKSGDVSFMNFSLSSDLNIALLDHQGRKLNTDNYFSWHQDFGLFRTEGLHAGLYFIQLQGQSRKKVFKIIIQ